MNLVEMNTLNQNYYPQKRVFYYHLRRYLSIAISLLTLKIIIPAVLG